MREKKDSREAVKKTASQSWLTAVVGFWSLSEAFMTIKTGAVTRPRLFKML